MGKIDGKIVRLSISKIEKKAKELDKENQTSQYVMQLHFPQK